MTTTIPAKVEKCRGAMLATAIGDALGWPNELRSKNKAKNFKVNDYFVEWTRRCNKPCYHDEKILLGEYSDDTQMTLSVARSLITGNWEKFLIEKELPFWLKYERGGGRALIKAAESCKKGGLLWQSNYTKDYFNAGGNGGVMRILPHVIVAANIQNTTGLILDVIKDTIITHGHPRAILGATCYAYALDYLLRKEGILEYGELVTAIIEGQKDWGAFPNHDAFQNWLEAANRHGDFKYANEWENVLASMIRQLEFIKISLKKGLMLDDASILTELGCFSKANGAGDVAILAAIYLASRYANSPALGIKVPAFSFGSDTDTIASITGGLLGMLCGTSWIPIEWKMVQDYDCLVRLTNLLLADNSKEAAKFDALELKIQENDWINTAIGYMRKTGMEVVNNGKYSIVTISKWQSVLGQTIYTKEMKLLNDELRQQENQMNLPQQITLYNFDKPSQTEDRLIDKATDSRQATQKIFVLRLDEAVRLMDNPLLQRITFKKVLKILDAMFINSATNTEVAKRFNVDVELVNIIKKFLSSS